MPPRVRKKIAVPLHHVLQKHYAEMPDGEEGPGGSFLAGIYFACVYGTALIFCKGVREKPTERVNNLEGCPMRLAGAQTIRQQVLMRSGLPDIALSETNPLSLPCAYPAQRCTKPQLHNLIKVRT
jgi:hypothetical protein